MNIEHMTDRNNTLTRGIGVTEMNDLQQALVADHIADLEREGTAIRAERFRDHRREQTDHAATRRVRLGHWLVSVGEAIAGSRRGDTAPAAIGTNDDPRDDGRDQLATAA
jgi:hypothetical protein